MSSAFFNADNLALLLREHEGAPEYLAVKIADAFDASADEITRLRARVSALEARLAQAVEVVRPFAQRFEDLEKQPRADPIEIGAHGIAAHQERLRNWKAGHRNCVVGYGELRAARALHDKLGETP